jgi:N-acetylglucosamine-6-sulfatase
MSRRLVLAAVWLVSWSAAVGAEQLDCSDVDHDCDVARNAVRSGIERAAKKILECARHRAASCDLAPMLRAVADDQCRDAIECEVHALFDQVAGGGTPCVRHLFREGSRFMSKKVARLHAERPAAIPGDLTRCKTRGGVRCGRAVLPPLTDSCAGKTTPADASACVCDAANSISDRLLLPRPTCIPRPPPPCPVTTVPGAPQPNFVVILSDDQRWDTVDATHQARKRPGYVMPNVRRELISSGVTFTEGHVTTAVCCPSRASILTGQYAHNTGVRENLPPDGGVEVFDDHCTVARWLKAQGYVTGFIGKYLNGYATLSPCIPPGYDDWFVQVQVKYLDYDVNHDGVLQHYGSADADYSGDVMTRHAVDFIHARGVDGKRFFLHLSQKGPHPPATPARRHVGLFAGIAPFRPPNYAEADVADKPAWVRALAWTRRDAAAMDAFRVRQLETLQAVDEGVAAVMQALRDIGQERTTLVIYTSDNGYSWGAHRWPQKECPYEECIRVPLVMRYPALAGVAPRTDGRIVLNVDFAATIADLAGVRPPELVNGASVVPLLAGTATGWRTDLLNEHWGLHNPIPTNALVKGRFEGHTWKLVEYVTGETELYDLDADPFELTNVTNDPAHAALKAAMAARLHQLQSE